MFPLKSPGAWACCPWAISSRRARHRLARADGFGRAGALVDAHWGDTQVLVIDLPPVQATCSSPWCKSTSRRAVIVSTPQDLALMDATRALNLFDAAKVPVIGLVENMAGYVCPHCGNVSDPFGSGGVEQAAADLGLPFLGVPLDLSIRWIDAGRRPPPAKARRPKPFAHCPHGEGLAEGARLIMAITRGRC
jgi:ATP-binding protein involved in chromosome partitioning